MAKRVAEAAATGALPVRLLLYNGQRPSKYHSNPAAGEQVNHEFMAEIQTELGRHGSHLAFTLLTHNRPTALI